MGNVPQVLGPALRPKLTKEFEAWQGFKPNKPTAMRAPAASVTASVHVILLHYAKCPYYSAVCMQSVGIM